MASNLECVGIAVGDRAEFARLVEKAMADAEKVAAIGAVSVYAWQDPSGARLIISTEGREIVDLLPSYAGSPGARLAQVRVANEEVAIANVVDSDGEMATMLAVELEQRRMLARAPKPVEGEACIVALGVGVDVHADEEAFAASDSSLLSPGKDPGEPPAHVVEQGMKWPMRVASESFMSYGVFGSPDGAEAYARLHGTVVSAQTRTNELTGNSFHAVRVRTAGFEVDMCLPATIELPRPGNIIGGQVFLVGSIPSLQHVAVAVPGERRGWLPWRRR